MFIEKIFVTNMLTYFEMIRGKRKYIQSRGYFRTVKYK